MKPVFIALDNAEGDVCLNVLDIESLEDIREKTHTMVTMRSGEKHVVNGTAAAIKAMIEAALM